MARKHIAKKHILRDGDKGQAIGVQIQFLQGQAVTLYFEDLNETMLAEATAHGLSQKLGDSFAGAKGDINLALAECEMVAQNLLDGSWNRRGGPGGSTDLAAAIAALTGKDQVEIEATLLDMGKEDREALAKRPAVKAEIAKIRAERLAARVGAKDDDLSMFLKPQAG